MRLLTLILHPLTVRATWRAVTVAVCLASPGLAGGAEEPARNTAAVDASFQITTVTNEDGTRWLPDLNLNWFAPGPVPESASLRFDERGWRVAYARPNLDVAVGVQDTPSFGTLPRFRYTGVSAAVTLSPEIRARVFAGPTPADELTGGANLIFDAVSGQVQTGVGFLSVAGHVISTLDVTGGPDDVHVGAGLTHDHTTDRTGVHAEVAAQLPSGEVEAAYRDQPLGLAGQATGKRETEAAWTIILGPDISLRLDGWHRVSTTASTEGVTTGFGVALRRPQLTVWGDWSVETAASGVAHAVNLGWLGRAWTHEMTWWQQCGAGCETVAVYEVSGVVRLDQLKLEPSFGVAHDFTTGDTFFSGGVGATVQRDRLELMLGVHALGVSRSEYRFEGGIGWRTCPVTFRLSGVLETSPDLPPRAVIRWLSVIPARPADSPCAEAQIDEAIERGRDKPK